MTLSTPELQLGDTMIFYGMWILLDTEARIWDGGQGRAVYAWHGTITNLDEVLATRVAPRTMLYNNVFGDDGGLRDQIDGRWTIQGNQLASWTVER